MKKLLLLLIATLLFVGCSKDDNEPKTEEPINPLIGTMWVADDEISELVYGGDWQQALEFLSDTEYQYIRLKNGNAQTTVKGTYVFNDPTIELEREDKEETLEINGSIMTSKTQGKPSGGFVIYTKQ